MPKLRILFVDDEENILSGLRRMLRDQDEVWEMEFCSRPLEVMDRMRQAPFDAMVVDISMPGMSGLELLTEVKADPRTRDTEVIILTGLLDDSMKRQALSSGAADLLNKPVLREDLLARLRGTLRSKSLVDELEHQSHENEKQLLAAQRVALIGALAAHAVRDMTQMMTSMIWQSDLAQQMLDSEPPGNPQLATVSEALGMITSSSNRAMQQLEYILRLSRQEGELRQPCDVSRQMEEVAELLRGVLAKGVKVNCETPRRTELLVSADPARLFQLVINLALFVGTGLKAGAELNCSCVSETAGQEDGQGSIARITLHSSTSLHGGTELKNLIAGDNTDYWRHVANPADLSVARRIAESLDGSLNGTVSAAAGTTLTLELPLITAQVAVAAAG